MTQEEVNKILVEAEVDENGNPGCWHIPLVDGECTCGRGTYEDPCFADNPDFSKWENFGRLLKLINEHFIDFNLWRNAGHININISGKGIVTENPDQIPALVSTELARIIKKGRE